MWIRGAKWDAFWILSGFPIGLALTAAGVFVDPAILIMYALVALQTPHSLAPIAAAWDHAGFRRLMLRRPLKFIALPLALIVMTTAAGIAADGWFAQYQFTDDSSTGLLVAAFWRPGAVFSPIWVVLVIYYFWNAYHFAMQNFGVMQIYLRKSGFHYLGSQRKIDMGFCVLVQVAVAAALFLPKFGQYIIFPRMIYTTLACAAGLMLAREAAISGRWFTPRILFALSHSACFILGGGIWVVAINGINHWLVAIGLASHVNGAHKGRSPAVLAICLLVAGFALFWLLFWRGTYSWSPRDMMRIALPFFGFRIGLGFAHFLYDRWIWKLSDPAVRATIGGDLLKERDAAPLGPIPAMALSRSSA